MKRIHRILLAAFFGLLPANPGGLHGAETPASQAGAFALAGLVLDHGHRIRPNEATVNVRVVTEVVPEEHAGKSYDIIFLILPSSLEAGHIVTLTSGSTASCRPSLQSLINESLTAEIVSEAYPGAKLTRVEDNAAVRELAGQWRSRGWLRNCAEAADGDHDTFEVLILNDAEK